MALILPIYLHFGVETTLIKIFGKEMKQELYTHAIVFYKLILDVESGPDP